MSGPFEPGTTTVLTHVRNQLALHHLRAGAGRPLLLLHGLGEATPASVPEELAAWPGPIHGLDLTGHGASSLPRGGGYTAEILMADVDHALEHLGECTIVGRGLGAYVALLIAGARPRLVAGAILRDGPGLAGGGPSPTSPSSVRPWALGEHGTPPTGTPDPFALAELARDIRPPDYAGTYLRQALQFSGLENPIYVTSVVRPPWLAAVAAEPGVVDTDLDAALAAAAVAERGPVEE